MKCPNCEKKLVVPNRAFHNAEAYGEDVKVTTECCFTIVRIIPITTFKVERAIGNDWGGAFGPVDDWEVPEGEEAKRIYKEL